MRIKIVGDAVVAGSGIRMCFTEYLLANLKAFTVQRFSVFVAPLCIKIGSVVVVASCCIRVRLTECLLVNLKGFTEQRLSVFIAPLFFKIGSEAAGAVSVINSDDFANHAFVSLG